MFKHRNQGVNVTESRSQQLIKRLREMKFSASDIIASSLISSDGLTIASAMPEELEDEACRQEGQVDQSLRQRQGKALIEI